MNPLSGAHCLRGVAVRHLKITAAGSILAVCAAMYGGVAPAAEFQSPSRYCHTRSITDMTGREVTVPCTINRIATVGSVPVINSYLFALGEGNKIVNGLPYFARSKRWRMQTAVAPHLSHCPMLQAQDREVSMEMLISLRPDVVIVMETFRTKALEATGIPVICLEWRDVSEVKENMRILGLLLDRKSRSEAYLSYFERTMNRVRQALSGIARDSAPKVLFFDPNTLRTPLPISDWWIHEAGGKSVTAGTGRAGTVSYSHEHILLWNPDIMIVSTPDHIPRVYGDQRLSKVSAVLNRRVYAMPMGVHLWGHRTAEQPLTVLWAAKIFYPDRFRQINMGNEIKAFYRQFFDCGLSEKETRAILTGH